MNSFCLTCSAPVAPELLLNLGRHRMPWTGFIIPICPGPVCGPLEPVTGPVPGEPGVGMVVGGRDIA